MTGSYWTCRRKTLGIPCGRVNPGRVQKCRACDGRKPAKRRPKHMEALELSYAEYVALNGGEFCGICGAPPKPGRRLYRDHEHAGNGKPRGLLCFGCNRILWKRANSEWLELATAYFQRADAR